MTLTLTLKLKIAFWTLLPPGAYYSVSQTHFDIFLNCFIALPAKDACNSFSVTKWLILRDLKNASVFGGTDTGFQGFIGKGNANKSLTDGQGSDLTSRKASKWHRPTSPKKM